MTKRLALCLSLVSCTAKLPLANDVDITCTSAADCPSGRVCAVDVGRCVPPGQSCVTADGDTFRSQADGNQCALADGTPAICVAGNCQVSACGDGYTDTTRGETCDNGASNSDTVPGACRTSCRLPACGDHIVDPGEACDDGNTVSGDGCTADCSKIEMCGNAFVDVGETCDDANSNANDGCDQCQVTVWKAAVLAGLGLGEGVPSQTSIDGGQSLAYDSAARLYIGDANYLRRFDPATQTLELLAGIPADVNNSPPPVDGPAVAVETAIGQVLGIAIDEPKGIIYIASGSNVLYAIDRNGVLTRVFGSGTAKCTCNSSTCTSSGLCGDGDIASAAQSTNVHGVALDGDSNLFVLDGQRVRRIDHDSQDISTVAGSGATCPTLNGVCGDGGAATSASFAAFFYIALDSAGNLYVDDLYRVRKISKATGIVTAFAGTGDGCDATCGEGASAATARIGQTAGIAFDRNDNAYVVTSSYLQVRKIDATTGVLTTVAGARSTCADPSSPCGDGGPASAAKFAQLHGIATSPTGEVAMMDQAGAFDLPSRVRVVATNSTISTVAGTGINDLRLEPVHAAPTSAIIGAATSIYDALGNFYVTDRANSVIFRVDPAKPQLEPIAGLLSPSQADAGFGHAALDVSIFPLSLVVDGQGNVFFSDQFGVRRLDKATGILDSIAGSTSSNCADEATACGDGDNALLATFVDPGSLALDAAGDLIIADRDKIRKLSLASCSAANGWQCPISTIAGSGTPGYNGDHAGTATDLNCLYDVAAAADGTIYFADFANCRLRSLTPAGDVVTLVDLSAQGVDCGTPNPELDDSCQSDSFSGDEPVLFGVAVDDSNDVYYALLVGADATIHRLEPAGDDTVVLGGTGNLGTGDGLAGTQTVVFASDLSIGPSGLLLAGGSYGVTADTNVGVARVADLTSFRIKTVAGDVDGLAAGALAISQLADPEALTPLPGGLGWLVADGNGGQGRRIDVTRDYMDVVAGYPFGIDDTTSARAARYAELFANAVSIAFDPVSSTLYVGEKDTPRIRAISMPNLADATTWQSQVLVSAAAGGFGWPAGLAVDVVNRKLYLADPLHHVIMTTSLAAGAPTTFTPVVGRVDHSGFLGENVDVSDAILNGPLGVAVGPDGALYIADTDNQRVRRVGTDNVISTVIGDGTPASGGAGTPALIFEVNAPQGIAFDSFGNMFITSKSAVRMIVAPPSSDGRYADQPVQTIYGAAPRSAFPDSETNCINGVSVASDDASVAVLDHCAKILVQLTRTRAVDN